MCDKFTSVHYYTKHRRDFLRGFCLPKEQHVHGEQALFGSELGSHTRHGRRDDRARAQPWPGGARTGSWLPGFLTLTAHPNTVALLSGIFRKRRAGIGKHVAWVERCPCVKQAVKIRAAHFARPQQIKAGPPRKPGNTLELSDAQPSTCSCGSGGGVHCAPAR